MKQLGPWLSDVFPSMRTDKLCFKTQDQIFRKPDDNLINFIDQAMRPKKIPETALSNIFISLLLKKDRAFKRPLPKE